MDIFVGVISVLLVIFFVEVLTRDMRERASTKARAIRKQHQEYMRKRLEWWDR
jgi:hypothetical protein